MSSKRARALSTRPSSWSILASLSLRAASFSAFSAGSSGAFSAGVTAAAPPPTVPVGGPDRVGRVARVGALAGDRHGPGPRGHRLDLDQGQVAMPVPDQDLALDLLAFIGLPLGDHPGLAVLLFEFGEEDVGLVPLADDVVV